MAHNPFTPAFDRLPQTLPIFPLSGAILLPGTQLPLNIFEPRYLNMVFDALGTARLIGMVQPVEAGDTLAEVGCAGQITAFNETDDGRLLLVLQGVCRFRLGAEIPTTRGYRCVVPEWSSFALDYNEASLPAAARQRLLTTLERYTAAQQMEIERKHLDKMSDAALVDALVANLPISDADKQELLEIGPLAERAEQLMGVMMRTTYPYGSGLQAVH